MVPLCSCSALRLWQHDRQLQRHLGKAIFSPVAAALHQPMPAAPRGALRCRSGGTGVEGSVSAHPKNRLRICHFSAEPNFSRGRYEPLSPIKLKISCNTSAFRTKCCSLPERLICKKVGADPKESTTVFDFLLKIEKANVTCAGIEVSAGPLFTQDFF